jgi:uncharacterized protein (DUF2252 family)
VLIFDVNDFDEAYLGHFTWDLQRMVASVALLGWRKALSDPDIDALVATYVRAYTDQVRQFLDVDDDRDFSLRLNTTDGVVHELLQLARLRTRFGLLESVTEAEGFDRRFRDRPGVRRLDDAERDAVCAAFERYLDTIPESKKFRGIAYAIKDVVGPGWSPTNGSRPISSTTATAPPSRSARCRRTPTRCWGTPSWTGWGTWSPSCPRMSPIWTGPS